eukprot:c8744_g1_i2.p1 GENE.c8744_g1_i2~~c8744_g1_i2.p1  ORF type:complete len:543 (+),score=136.83 c8744_g1_i2:68-1696(+)
MDWFSSDRPPADRQSDHFSDSDNHDTISTSSNDTDLQRIFPFLDNTMITEMMNSCSDTPLLYSSTLTSPTISSNFQDHNCPTLWNIEISSASSQILSSDPFIKTLQLHHWKRHTSHTLPLVCSHNPDMENEILEFSEADIEISVASVVTFPNALAVWVDLQTFPLPIIPQHPFILIASTGGDTPPCHFDPNSFSSMISLKQSIKLTGLITRSRPYQPKTQMTPQQTLSQMFPEIDLSTLDDLLVNCNNDVNQVVAHLVGENPKPKSAFPPSKPKTSKKVQKVLRPDIRDSVPNRWKFGSNLVEDMKFRNLCEQFPTLDADIVRYIFVVFQKQADPAFVCLTDLFPQHKAECETDTNPATIQSTVDQQSRQASDSNVRVPPAPARLSIPQSEVDQQLLALTIIRRNALCNARREYIAGNAREVSRFMAQAKKAFEKIERLNQQQPRDASMIGRAPMQTIDLHGYLLDEAESVLLRKLKEVETMIDLDEHYPKQVTVITGVGNHSIGRPVLRPKIKEFLERQGYGIRENIPGQLIVSVKSTMKR